MTVVAVKKFLFIGLEASKSAFFEEAQKLGKIDFLNVSNSTTEGLAKEILAFENAIKVLRGLPVIDQVDPGNFRKAKEIADEILEYKHRIETLEEEIRVLHLEIARIEPFGQFNLDDLAYIEREGKRKIRFFAAKVGHFEGKELPADFIPISSDHGLDYFLSISKEPVPHEKVVEMEFSASLSSLEKKVDQNKREIRKNEEKLKQLARYKQFLHRSKIAALNIHNYKVNAEFPVSLLDKKLFAVEGWVPVDQMENVFEIAKKTGTHFEEIAVQEQDRIPTVLKNTGMARIGEDLVHIYDTPSPTDKDPSLWVLGAFSLFFALIVNDAGYASLYFLLFCYLNWKFQERKPELKRFFRLGLMVTAVSLVWGMMSASYFGMSLDMENPLRRYSLLQWMSEKKAEYHLREKDDYYEEWAKEVPEAVKEKEGYKFFQATQGKGDILDGLNRNILFELALVVGVVHTILSLARYLGRNWNGLGWILFLVGAFLYFPHYLGQSTMLNYIFGVPSSFGESEGLQLIYAGVIVAVVLSIFRHKWLGLLEPMTVIQVFADVLSYLRLYALGLAGAIVGSTINSLYGAIPLLLAVIVIVISHGVNMLLGVMSGTIHGLRLNFIEWYHYSFEGGGKAFDPLRLYEVD